jgi:hypothetical protein
MPTATKDPYLRHPASSLCSSPGNKPASGALSSGECLGSRLFRLVTAGFLVAALARGSAWQVNLFAGKLASMKTTIDLPADLIRQLKVLAANEGTKLKDLVTRFLFLGLANKNETKLRKPRIKIDKLSGLPLVMGGRKPLPGHELTDEKMKQILYDQDIEHYFAGLGLGAKDKQR